MRSKDQAVLNKNQHLENKEIALNKTIDSVK